MTHISRSEAITPADSSSFPSSSNASELLPNTSSYYTLPVSTQNPTNFPQISSSSGSPSFASSGIFINASGSGSAAAPAGTSATTTSSDGDPTSHIPSGVIGGIIAGIILLLLATTGTITTLRRRRRLGRNMRPHPSVEPYVRTESRGQIGEIFLDADSCPRTSFIPYNFQTLENAKSRAESSSQDAQELFPAAQSLHQSLEVEYTPTIDEQPRPIPSARSAHNMNREVDHPAPMRPFVIDATSLPELVERVTYAVLSQAQLGRARTGEEQPPQYVE